MSPDRKRRYPRIKSQHVVHISNVTFSDKSHYAIARELGAGGCLVQSAESLGIGRVLFFEIVVGMKTMRVIGKVLYEWPEGGNSMLSGIEFISLFTDDLDYLTQFVSDHMPSATAHHA